jgi:hypothetical protein
VTTLNNLAILLQAQGDLAAARPLLERALAIREKVRGPEHPDTPWSLDNLARLLHLQGDLAAARPLFDRALAIREKVCGPEHRDTATSLNDLALLLRDQGDLAAARPLLERALAIREKVRGPEHPDTAISLDNLARLLHLQGHLAAARPLFDRALARPVPTRSGKPRFPTLGRSSGCKPARAMEARYFPPQSGDGRAERPCSSKALAYQPFERNDFESIMSGSLPDTCFAHARKWAVPPGPSPPVPSQTAMTCTGPCMRARLSMRSLQSA